jgi:competence protein ComEA
MQIVEMIKRHAFLLLGGACLFVVGLIYVIAVRGGEEPYLEQVERDGVVLFSADYEWSEMPVPPVVTEYIFVQVAGEVYEPGVFSLPSDYRIFHAIHAAGGLTGNAHPHFNQAAPLADGSIIIVPAYYEDVSPDALAPVAGYRGITADGRVNINTASYTELRTLPQIGTARAQSIIAFREAHGAFSSIEDLMLVHGIGTGIFSQLRDMVVVP